MIVKLMREKNDEKFVLGFFFYTVFIQKFIQEHQWNICVVRFGVNYFIYNI